MPRPHLKLLLNVRSGRPPNPLVLLPLAMNAHFLGIKRMIANLKYFMPLGMDHAGQTARFEGQKVDRVWILVEEVNGAQGECPAEVNGQDNGGMFFGKVVFGNVVELSRGL